MIYYVLTTKQLKNGFKSKMYVTNANSKSACRYGFKDEGVKVTDVFTKDELCLFSYCLAEHIENTNNNLSDKKLVMLSYDCFGEYQLSGTNRDMGKRAYMKEARKQGKKVKNVYTQNEFKEICTVINRAFKKCYEQKS